MAESTSGKGNSGDFAKKVQRQLSRSKEKVKVHKNFFSKYFDAFSPAETSFSAGAAAAGESSGEQR